MHILLAGRNAPQGSSVACAWQQHVAGLVTETSAKVGFGLNSALK